MKKFYTEPELEIRKYSLSGNGVMTTSREDQDPEDGDLNKGDDYNLFG